VLFAALPALLAGRAAAAGSYEAYRVALILLDRDHTGAYRGGIDISLVPSWKTYWRMPGESGIPPRFDWSASRNLAEITVAFPAPRRYADQSGETVGYENGVVLPFWARPQRGDEPIGLDLQMFFAVCKDICIPAEVRTALDTAQARSERDAAARLLAAIARIPPRVDTSAATHIRAARLVEDNGRPLLEVELVGPGAEGPLDIFVEGYPRAYFRAPRPSNERGRYRLPIDAKGAVGDLVGRSLDLTVTGRDINLEQRVSVG
jgi:DsbC/DsbD-like thiol-disulfide interchange protein